MNRFQRLRSPLTIALFIVMANGWVVVENKVHGVAAQQAIAQTAQEPMPQETIARQANAFKVAQIRKVIDDTLTAAKKKDVNAVMRYLAPNATIDLTIQSHAGTRQLQLNRAQYQQYLQQGFQAAQTYDSKISNIKVQMMTGGKAAIATYTLTETVLMYEPPVMVSATTNSVVRFEPIQGQPLVTQVQSRSQVSVKPLEAKLP